MISCFSIREINQAIKFFNKIWPQNVGKLWTDEKKKKQTIAYAVYTLVTEGEGKLINNIVLVGR